MALSSTNNSIQQGYGAQGSPIFNTFPSPIIAQRDPTSADINYKVGRGWVNTADDTAWQLGSKTGGTAVWIALGSGTTGGVVTLTGDSGGPISPVAGNIDLLGTASEIDVTGTAGTLTWSLPLAIVAPGSLTTTTTLEATTTITAGTDITATAGDIVATAGAVSAGTTVTGGTGVVATTGNISATAGAVNAGTSMTATAGDITATLGHVIINGAAKQLRQHGGAATDFIGQATLTNGVATVLNTNIAATDRVFVTRTAKNTSTAYGTFQVVITASTNFVVTSCKSDTTTETNDQSTVDYIIVRQV
jgi:hypothetical protein